MKAQDLVIGAMVGAGVYLALAMLAQRMQSANAAAAAGWIPKWNPLNGALLNASNAGSGPGYYA